ncbi:MAG: hypothetical protein JXO49_07670 [Deltaproteobacteria bacterium]|nr:hypothetical protein [Candidatus Anaeroferrophillus wilburensis]MBN2889206.1 hypothetical protein [Deltaproteobacteria bacterium]
MAGKQSADQDLELKRLKRIEKLIVAFGILIAVTAFMMKQPLFRGLDALAGGVLAFLYFHFLAKTMHGAFTSPTEGPEEITISPRLVLKISALTMFSVIITLVLLVPKICQPVGFLIGFSAMFVAILSDAVFTGMFGTLKPKS